MAERVAATAKTSEEKQKCPNSCKQNMGFHTSESADMILQLQRTAGNQAVQRLIKSGAMQTKLKISKPDDSYEHKADRVTEQVMRRPEQQVSNETKTPKTTTDNLIQRKYPECRLKKEEEEKNHQIKKVSVSAPELTHTVQQDSARTSTVQNDIQFIPAPSGTVANVGTAIAEIPQPGMGLVPNRSHAIGVIPGASEKSGPKIPPEDGVPPEIKTEKAPPSTHEKVREKKVPVTVSEEMSAVREKPSAIAEEGGSNTNSAQSYRPGNQCRPRSCSKRT
jgi:hypothetical protein